MLRCQWEGMERWEGWEGQSEVTKSKGKGLLECSNISGKGWEDGKDRVMKE